MSDRRPVKIRPLEDGWKCPNRPCIKKSRNPLGSMNCTHCGCRFGAPYMEIGPPENSDGPEASTSPEKSDSTENAEAPENDKTTEKVETTQKVATTGKNDDKDKEKQKSG
ncbi:uncharacterized protein FIESC28_01861 [Fusarium coffeatum]|uniref:Uncharacterized protein n=1 Tax=Fusarium coffeatum TaxID=231269 RepID=A0A366S7Y6_9HYPO|nr:uncharacterized protein FIESC28_01861 [Fusarium coffeatum]RBR25424.1 hypothetical protein FIESC28_01861 [Fusarium coffeatum]